MRGSEHPHAFKGQVGVTGAQSASVAHVCAPLPPPHLPETGSQDTVCATTKVEGVHDDFTEPPESCTHEIHVASSSRYVPRSLQSQSLSHAKLEDAPPSHLFVNAYSKFPHVPSP